MIGAGIFRTPGVVAEQLGRPWLTFVAWVLGGLVAFAGALIFAELATRHPRAGGKYVYVQAAFGARAGFVVGVVEVGIYAVAIAALAVVAGEYAGTLAGLDSSVHGVIGAGVVTLFTLINLAGVSQASLVQNIATSAKVIALVGVIVIAFASGSGVGWGDSLPTSPEGAAILPALAVAFQSVIWSYYGYPDAAKIAEEVIDPNRSLPRILLISTCIVTALYLLLNAAFLHVLPIDVIASSKLVAGDVAVTIVGERGGVVVAALALLVVLASISGNVFVTPRVVFAISRDGIGPRALSRINRGGTPWAATLVVGGLAVALAVTGSFQTLLGIAITLVLVVDGITAFSLVRLRRTEPRAAFSVPGFPVVTIGFILVYAALFAVAVVADPVLALAGFGTLGATAVWSVFAVTSKSPAR